MRSGKGKMGAVSKVRHLMSQSLTNPVMVFLPTARAAALLHDVFAAMPISYPVWEIHSRMSQPARGKATAAFREAATGVLFSSDVTARGIDVKGVTAVMQVGLPMSADMCGSHHTVSSSFTLTTRRRASFRTDGACRCGRTRYPHPR